VVGGSEAGDGGVRAHDAGEAAGSGAARLATMSARLVALVGVGRRRRRTPSAHAGSPVSDHVVACRVYRDGKRMAEGVTPAEALRTAREHRGAFAWLGLFEPTAREMAAVADEYGLRPAPVHEVAELGRPRLADYDDVLLVTMRTARYVEHSELTGESEVVETGQLTVFLGAAFVVTVRRGELGGLQQLRARLEDDPTLLRHGPAAVLHAICNQVVDDYQTVTEQFETDIDDVEASVFSRSTRPTAEKVYQLKRELLELKHAVVPMATPVRTLADARTHLVDGRVREHFREAADRLDQVVERINHFDELLTSILQATLTQVTIAQNEDMRRISAWVAIAAVPTAVAGIYGMNFDHMPELRQTWGYPAVMAFIAAACFLLYRAFKRNDWL
jgi:magnesium transporter